MQGYFGYTRVSTVKQGDGVSLEAQQEAISTYAQKCGIKIAAWYEEKETAAKSGRPIFNKVITALRAGEAGGLIIHKIDRSARNFSDWAKIGELIDSGIDVKFAHESLDMQSRGGRLTADIQAVIAADYVRNLREECIKGIEGRLKQGLYPFKAPVGYLDQGSGKPKILDPERAPYVRQAFELYATGEYSIRGLLEELQRRGFRRHSGKPISKGCLEKLMSNPFYHGTIHIKRGNRFYRGLHEPIVNTELFNRVQALKSNRYNKKKVKHRVLFRRLICCEQCGRSLYGEIQKGHTYMRCQTPNCPTKTLREDYLEAEIGEKLRTLQLPAFDQCRLQSELLSMFKKRTKEADRRAVELQLSNLEERERRLTDSLIDGLIDRAAFSQRKESLELERENLRRSLADLGNIASEKEQATKFLELLKNLYLLYQMADPGKRRRIAEIAFSNRSVSGKKLYLQPQNWCVDVDSVLTVLCGGPCRDTSRIKEQVAEAIKLLD